ncbi:MAG TPA: response regulator [Anaerolineae bacterium]|nr:response regulator [Anaerolineae bacterium]
MTLQREFTLQMKAVAKPLRVLIVAGTVDAYSTTVKTLETLEGAHIVGTASGVSDAITLAEELKPDVVLVDPGLEGAEGISLIRDLAFQLPALPVVVVTPHGDLDLAHQAMLAGASGFVTKPFGDGEPLRTLRQIHELALSKGGGLTWGTAQPNGPPSQGQILAVYSPKGGVGRTAVAVNLAVALRMATKKGVVLVDGNVQFGDAGLALNIRSSHNILDLVPRVDELDTELMNSVLARHSSGIRVLLGPFGVEGPDVIHPAHLSKILGRLQEMFDYVVVDTWPFLDGNTLAILDLADRIVLVLTPELSSLRNARLFLELARSLEYPSDKLLLALNRYSDKGPLQLKEIEEHLKLRIPIQIPEDERLVTYSMNRGTPLVTSHRRSAVAHSFFQLAQVIAEERAATREPAQVRAETKPRRTVSLLKRLAPSG